MTRASDAPDVLAILLANENRCGQNTKLHNTGKYHGLRKKKTLISNIEKRTKDDKFKLSDQGTPLLLFSKFVVRRDYFREPTIPVARTVKHTRTSKLSLKPENTKYNRISYSTQ